MRRRRVLASKGHYTATFRSLFGDVPIRIRRLSACLYHGTGGAKSFAAFDLKAATVAPELAYVTARYAALAPFGKVADLLSELLPVSGAANASTVRNRTMRVGEAVVLAHVTTTAETATAMARRTRRGWARRRATSAANDVSLRLPTADIIQAGDSGANPSFPLADTIKWRIPGKLANPA